MSIVELDARDEAFIARRNHKLERSERAERLGKPRESLVLVEAAVVAALEEPASDPEFDRALRIVANSVKHLLSPQAIGFLEGTLSSDERAGSVRWRELAMLDLWMRRATLPIGHPGRKLLRARRFTQRDKFAQQQAREHPMRLFDAKGRVPGRTMAAIMSLARRAQVSPSTVVAALLHFGLERVGDAIRRSKEVPPSVTREMNDAFPVYGENT